MRTTFTDAKVIIDGEKTFLCLAVPHRDAQKFVGEKKPVKYSAEIKEYREKRSLNANALCWKVCTEIANIFRLDKEDVYVKMLKRYGQSDVVSVLSQVDVSGYFKYYDTFGTGYANGKEFTHYRVYKGSSEYDKREMAILLDGIIEEAKALGVEVLTEQELSLIKENWGE